MGAALRLWGNRRPPAVPSLWVSRPEKYIYQGSCRSSDISHWGLLSIHSVCFVCGGRIPGWTQGSLFLWRVSPVWQTRQRIEPDTALKTLLLPSLKRPPSSLHLRLTDFHSITCFVRVPKKFLHHTTKLLRHCHLHFFDESVVGFAERAFLFFLRKRGV